MRENNPKVFGKNLNFLLKENKVLGKDLAPAIGVTVQTISEWRQGKRLPHPAQAEKVASYFGVRTEQLFSEDFEPVSVFEFTGDGPELPGKLWGQCVTHIMEYLSIASRRPGGAAAVLEELKKEFPLK